MNDPKESKYLKAFGKRVAEVRRARGFTQEELAAKTDITPLSIGFIEQGRRWPRILTMHKIADCLGVRLEDLFKGL